MQLPPYLNNDFHPLLTVGKYPLHLQGIAVSGNKTLYFSFTNRLIKTDPDGNILIDAEVKGGHLGDITWHCGKIYGTLLGEPRTGDPWDAWTSFQILVFDESLQLLEKIDLPLVQQYYRSKTNGICGIDGITFGRVPGGQTRMMIACAIKDENATRHYQEDILLQYRTDGTYETEYYIPTGYNIFGTQNLSYEEDSGNWWITAYAPEADWHSKDTLYCISPDLKTIVGRWPFLSPYGFVPLGNRKYLCTENIRGADNYHTAVVRLCRFDPATGMVPIEN